MRTITLKTSRTRFLVFLKDREYLRELIRFALPIAIQNLIMSSLNMVGVIMIGQLGETPVAAVGLANQIFFLLQLVLFGTNSGAAIFTAQFWGKGDIQSLRKVSSLALLIGLSVALVFLGGALLAPDFLLGIYSTDPAVISVGSQYLQIFGWSFLFVAISFSFSIVLRSIGEVRIPMLVSTGALGFNAILSYILIFGKLGLPQMGVSGAAFAGLLARILECALLIGIVYLRRMPVALRLSDFNSLNFSSIIRIFRPILPVILNETFWSLGSTAYFIVYARIGTESVAAMNIVATIENMALVIIFGVAHATAIMVGNRIGAANEQQAYEYATRSFFTAIVLGVFIGSLLLLSTPIILSLYKVGPTVIDYARRALTILALLLWVRASNILIVVGILRSGGDTRFSLFLDGVIIWLLGVPLAFFTAFVLRWPVYWVYLAVLSEEIFKCTIGIWRVFSKKWIHNMSQAV